MKLDEFVKKTLLDITNGVSEAQKSSPIWIAPGVVEGKKIETFQNISFEVQVVVNSEMGGSISVIPMVKADGKRTSQNVNKISFEVPVYFQAPKLK